jgi:hypothetical protein
LGINYSTAKTIVRIFRNEKRVNKKCPDEEREIRGQIDGFRTDDIGKSYITIDQDLSSCDKSPGRHLCCEQGKGVEDIYSLVYELSTVVKRCVESIKINQQMINNLIINSIKLNEELMDRRAIGKKICLYLDGVATLAKEKYEEGIIKNII